MGAERLVSTPYRIPFRENVQRTQLCEVVLNETEVQFLKQGIREDYYFQVSAVVAFMSLAWQEHPRHSAAARCATVTSGQVVLSALPPSTPCAPTLLLRKHTVSRP